MKHITSLLLLGTAAASTNIHVGKSLRILHSHPDIWRQLQFNVDPNSLAGCPDACSSPEICSIYESQTTGDLAATSDEDLQVITDACDSGTLWECAPPMLSQACGLCDGGGGLLASFVPAEDLDMICSSCAFLDCCKGEDGFDVCSENLPEELLTGAVVGTSSTFAAITGATSGAAATTTSAQITTIEEGASTTTATEAATATPAATETTQASSTASIAEESSTTSSTTAAAETTTAASQPFSEEDDILNTIEGDDLFGGTFGGDIGGTDDFFGSIGDFIGGIFGGDMTGDMNYTVDDDWYFSNVFNQSGEDDFLSSFLGVGSSESNGTGGDLGDMLGGFIEAIGGIFGNMGGNDTDWVDKGNFTGWQDDDMMFGSSMMCSEDSACPVDGFCECMNGDLSKCSLTLMDDVCSSGAAFSCAPEGFEEMCNNECPPPPRRLQGQGPFAISGNASASAVLSETESYSAPNCMMCYIARCCESEGATMDQCAKEVGIDVEAIMMNLTDIGEVLGDFVNEIMENVTGLLDELIGNITIPEFCPGGSCSVDGFCECFQGNFMQCNEQVMREACENDAFFGECGPENFQDFCSTECNGEADSMLDVANMALCSMCSVAKCCHEQGSPDECVFTGLSFTSSTSPSTTDGTAADATDVKQDSMEDQGEVSENEVGSEGTGVDDETFEAESSVASASAQEDGSSGASRIFHVLLHGALMASVLLYFI